MTGPIHFDDVIIGGGSAGCAAAYGLATRTSRRVLLIEAGPDTRTLETRLPALVRAAVGRFDWGYVSEPDASRASRRESWARGRILGGSSSVNGMMFVRGAPSDYDRWASLQNAGWSWADVEPLFRELESSDRPGLARGRVGPLSVRTIGRPHRLTQAFLDASAAAGFPANPDYNGESQTGFGLAQLSQRRGLRCSAADAFVSRIRARPNVTIWSGCEVDRLVFEGGAARQALCRRNGSEVAVEAERFVVSAGAVGSPKLLMLSGVGDPAALSDLGIPLAIAAPQVGQNLREHPLVRLVFETHIRSRNLTGGPLQQLGEAADFALRREGMLASVFEAAGFVKSDERLAHPDIQYHFLPLGILDPVLHADALLKVPSLTLYANLSHPQGRGRLELASNDPAESPRLFPNLLGGGEADLKTLVQAIRIARRIMDTPPMKALVKREVAPGADIASDADLADYVRHHTEIAYHIAGTCRMGSDPDAVVAPDLKLNGARNVWVADASIFPDLISGNTNAACMMVGLKLGRALADAAGEAAVA